MKKYYIIVTFIILLVFLLLSLCGRNIKDEPETEPKISSSETISESSTSEDSIEKIEETKEVEKIEETENPENNEPEFNYDVTPIVFKNFASCYELIGAEDYDYLQQCVEAFAQEINIRQSISTVTLNEGSVAIDGINKSFEIVFDNNDTYLVVMSPSIYPRDHAVDFSFYKDNQKLFSSDESF